MKKYLLYITAFMLVFTTGCSDFGKEEQLSLPDGPAVQIADIAVSGETGEAISFTVAPSGEAGFYSWLLVEADDPATLSATSILKLEAGGEAKGLVNYADAKSKAVTVEDLVPNTVYQIYAVAASTDGMVGAVANAQIRTGDDGGKPAPRTFSSKDKTVTITFSEPIKRGIGNVYVSYYAKHSLLEGDPLAIKPGHEAYNKVEILVPEDDIKVSGDELAVTISDAAPGVYANITFQASAVVDLDGNGCNAFNAKPKELKDGVPSGGVIFRLPVAEWKLKDEFTKDDDDTGVTADAEVEFPISFSNWEEFVIKAVPVEETPVVTKMGKIIPEFSYKTPGKTVKVNATTWGTREGIPAFMLPEAPEFGATVDLKIPKGAYEDVYGNQSVALELKDMFLHSFGYTMDDIVGVYDVNVTSYFTGPKQHVGIVIEPGEGENEVLIKNFIIPGYSEFKGEFDPVFGVLRLKDEQLAIEDVDFGPDGIHDLYFVTNDGSTAEFAVPQPGIIKSKSGFIWGFYILALEGYLDAYTESEWTRTSTTIPAEAPALNSVRAQFQVKKDAKLKR